MIRIELLSPQNPQRPLYCFCIKSILQTFSTHYRRQQFPNKDEAVWKRIIDFQTASPYKNRTILPINDSQYGAAAFETGLFQFGFFIDNVFAGNRIKFFDF